MSLPSGKAFIQIRFPNSYCGIFIDRFGKDITFFPVDEGHSRLSVDVAVSNQFFGWIFALGPEVKVEGPEEVTEQIKKAAEAFIKNY
ncbi:MAG: WYL domain-containing protein [Lachnospiraceae bacterium]|nr:WYL domain-containing protein [Lachnospiraceae bacterium]